MNEMAATPPFRVSFYLHEIVARDVAFGRYRMRSDDF